MSRSVEHQALSVKKKNRREVINARYVLDGRPGEDV